ncbi:MAG: hypothetical protein ABIG10_04040 [bacterium]
MTLTPEQFNKLATKDEFNELKEEVKELRKEFNEFKNNIFDVLDCMVKKLNNIEHSFVYNLAAHDRFETRIGKTEKHLNLNPYSNS